MNYTQYKQLPSDYVKAKLSEFFQEDAPNGDITSNAIFSGTETCKAIIQAEEDLILAGACIIQNTFALPANIKLNFNDGEQVKKSDIIAEITAPTKEVLLKERVLLNILQRLCGIATLTAEYVKIANPYKVKILDTRKTTPGLRLFEKYAVTCGGGFNHRLDLSSGILIKDNHIKAVGSITSAIQKIKAMNLNLPIEIEVENQEHIKEALEEGVDGFLLDNMSPIEVIKCVMLIRDYLFGDKIFIEASGGINLNNLSEYVKTGVNAISSGALTHSAKSSNLHLEFL